MSKPPIGGWLPIELAFREEAASALKAKARQLEHDITELKSLYERARKDPSLEPKLEARRKDAERHRWELIVQREAMGITHHDDVYALYDLDAVPEKLRR
jgi:hypothetical protein